MRPLGLAPSFRLHRCVLELNPRGGMENHPPGFQQFRNEAVPTWITGYDQRQVMDRPETERIVDIFAPWEAHEEDG
jgi:hypothetical protein